MLTGWPVVPLCQRVVNDLHDFCGVPRLWLVYVSGAFTVPAYWIRGQHWVTAATGLMVVVNVAVEMFGLGRRSKVIGGGTVKHTSKFDALVIWIFVASFFAMLAGGETLHSLAPLSAALMLGFTECDDPQPGEPWTAKHKRRIKTLAAVPAPTS